jgi:hypothetical protein
MRTMKPIIIAGLILSSSAIVYNATGYRISTTIAKSLVETRPYENSYNSHIVDFLDKNHCNSESIQLVSGALKVGDGNRQLSSTLAEDSKVNALTQGFLWLGVTLIFIILLIRNNKAIASQNSQHASSE